MILTGSTFKVTYSPRVVDYSTTYIQARLSLSRSSPLPSRHRQQHRSSSRSSINELNLGVMSRFRSVASTDGKYISIPADNDHVWIQTKKKKLFVRSCYNDLWGQIAEQYFTADGQFKTGKTLQGFVISGTPGIGKSCFLDFCLHKLLELGKSVCYFYGKSEKAFIYKADGTVENYTLADNHNGALALQVDFLLIDPPESGLPNFLGGSDGLMEKNYVLAVSPDRNNCQAIRKDCSKYKRFMGTCDLQEAKDMRVACYEEKVTEDQLVKRYEEFGGIPRCLCEEHLDDDEDEALNEYRDSQRAALMDVVKNPNRIDDLESSEPFKSLWTIFHLEPTVDYKHYTINPCCDDFAIRIRDLLMKKGVRELWDVFMDTREELGALRGIRYEAYAHKKILTEGFVASVPLLTQAGVSHAIFKNINIPAGSTQINLPNNSLGQDLSDAIRHAMEQQKGGYLLPHLPNFPVLDSIYVSCGTFVVPGPTFQLQMKAGRSRPLATDRARSIETATGCNEMYFIVPDDITMTRKLPGVDWRQYRAILKEE